MPVGDDEAEADECSVPESAPFSVNFNEINQIEVQEGLIRGIIAPL
jgi:CheY-like chemotaxis protein